MSMKKRISDAIARQINEDIGGRVCAKRIERGLSQNELSAFIGVSFQQVQKYEHRARIDQETAAIASLRGFG